MNGVPLTSGHAEAPAAGNAGREASGAYRPRYELVAEQILQLISELALQPGDRMPTEKDLAARLGTSRTVAREAVKILSATGRVSAQKGRGLYVADGESMLGARQWGGFFVPTNLDHIFMLFEFRRIQEMQASRLAARRASPSELRVIEAAVQTCRHGYTSGEQRGVRPGRRRLPPRRRRRLAQLLPRLRGPRSAHAAAPGQRHRPARSGRPRRRRRRRARGDLPGDQGRRARSSRPGHLRAPGQHPGGLPPRDPAPRVRLMTMCQISLGRTGLHVSEMIFGGAPIGGLYAPVKR